MDKFPILNQFINRVFEIDRFFKFYTEGIFLLSDNFIVVDNNTVYSVFIDKKLYSIDYLNLDKFIDDLEYTDMRIEFDNILDLINSELQNVYAKGNYLKIFTYYLKILNRFQNDVNNLRKNTEHVFERTGICGSIEFKIIKSIAGKFNFQNDDDPILIISSYDLNSILMCLENLDSQISTITENFIGHYLNDSITQFDFKNKIIENPFPYITINRKNYHNQIESGTNQKLVLFFTYFDDSYLNAENHKVIADWFMIGLESFTRVVNDLNKTANLIQAKSKYSESIRNWIEKCGNEKVIQKFNLDNPL